MVDEPGADRRILNSRNVDSVELPFRYAEALEAKKQIYRGYDLELLRQRIAEFFSIDWSDDGKNVVDEAEGILRSGTSQSFAFPSSWDEITAGHTMWRARTFDAARLTSGDVAPRDLWEAPPSAASAGRLNAAGESLLYACVGDPIATLSEARVAAGSAFVLTGYEVISPFNVRRIGMTNPDPGLETELQEVERTLAVFVARALAAPAGGSGEKVYANTKALLRRFFPLEVGWESGWMFASTLNDGAVNVALEPAQAHANLRIWRALVGRVVSVTSGVPSVSLVSFSDGVPRFGPNIGFIDFPHDELHSLQAYFDFLL